MPSVLIEPTVPFALCTYSRRQKLTKLQKPGCSSHRGLVGWHQRPGWVQRGPKKIFGEKNVPKGPIVPMYWLFA